MIIDGAWSTVGSTNIDMRSFLHNSELNVVVLGARIIGSALAFEVVDRFIAAKFSATEERFVRRFKKVQAIEAKYMCGDGSANPA